MRNLIKGFGLLFIVTVVAVVYPISTHAQRTEYEISRDTITQWIYHNNVLKKKTYKQVTLPDGRNYSVWQQSVADSLQRWVQASFYPRGSALDIRYNNYTDFQNDKENIGPLHRYGLEYHMYPASYSKRLKKLDVGGEAPKVISIYANGPIGKYVKNLSGEGRNWFINMLPLEINSGQPVSKDDSFLEDIINYPAIAPYLHFHKKYAQEHSIIMVPGNQLPLRKVTIEEYLRAFEAFTKLRATTTDANYKLPAEFVAEELKRMEVTKERLQDRLGEPVRFAVEDGYYDPANIINAKHSKGEIFEIYQLSAESIALMRKDKPVWINIELSWSPEFSNNYHIYQSFCNNFNFGYLYDYFFNPEQVKKATYSPLQPVLKVLPQKTLSSERSTQSKKAKEDGATIFFEDFSGNSIGAEPVDWFSKQNNGSRSSKFCSVQRPQNEKGTWLRFYPGHVAICNELNKPLTPDFTISFDINCTDNYTWGSSGVTFYLSDIANNDELLHGNFGLENLGRGSNTTMMLKIRPATNNNEGVEFSFSKPKPGSKYSDLKNYSRSTSRFTGKRGSTKAKVVIRKKDAALLITVNDERLVDEKNIIPAGVTFSTMTWAALGNVMEGGDSMYLSNIKISKD